MKVRTDFVTNSSSSGFVIAFDIKFKNGKKASCSFDASSGDDGEHATTRVNKHSIDMSEGSVYADSKLLLDITSSEWEELEDWIDPWDALQYGGSNFHELGDLNLSKVKTPDQLINSVQRMCELGESHIENVHAYGKPDEPEVKTALDQAVESVKDAKKSVLEHKKKMLDEFANTIKKNFNSWDDVAEACVSFTDAGWGEGSVGSDGLTNMVAGSDNVRNSKDGSILSGGDRTAIEYNIDETVSQRYKDGEGFFYEI